MLAQAVEHAPPGVERLAHGVHEDERFARSRFEVMDLSALMLRFGFRLRRGGFRCGFLCNRGFRCFHIRIQIRGGGRRRCGFLAARAAHFQLAGQLDFDILTRMFGIDEFLDFKR